MGDVQKTEMRRVFMAACGQMLVIFRDEITKLPDDEAVKSMQYMLDQATEFWEKQV